MKTEQRNLEKQPGQPSTRMNQVKGNGTGQIIRRRGRRIRPKRNPNKLNEPKRPGIMNMGPRRKQLKTR